MDADIDTAFCPCGHLVCCSGCAERLDCCPLCRSEITQIQHIFLPNLKMAAQSQSEAAAMGDQDDLDIDTNSLCCAGSINSGHFQLDSDHMMDIAEP